MELIYADPDFNEIDEITCFERFDAQVGMSTENEDNDFELTMHEKVWAKSPIKCGYYVYSPDTPWGGRVDKITHSVSDERVRIYGTCWRGLLDRFAVTPAAGETHVIVSEKEANAMIADFLGSAPTYISADTSDSGIKCSGSVRYKSLLKAAETLLSEQGARLSVKYDGRVIVLKAEMISNREDEIEFSQEYDSSLVSTEQGEVYNHIIALGQGTMAERDIVEFWRLPDGTLTENASAQGVPGKEELSTYIYDYGSIESKSALKEAARRKLNSLSPLKKLEISISSGDLCLELGDKAGARDILTGMTAVLTVTAIRLVIEENSILITHTLS